MKNRYTVLEKLKNTLSKAELKDIAFVIRESNIEGGYYLNDYGDELWEDDAKLTLMILAEEFFDG